MRTFQCLLAAIFIGLTVMATPLSAVTVDICKTQWCERYAAENRTACSELPWRAGAVLYLKVAADGGVADCVGTGTHRVDCA